jgi:hypothetical protein
VRRGAVAGGGRYVENRPDPSERRSGAAALAGDSAPVAARPDLPVLLSSGYTGDILTSAEDAPWPLLRKPYTLEALAAAIEDAVKGGG